MYCEVCAGWGHKKGRCTTLRALRRESKAQGLHEYCGAWIRNRVGELLDATRGVREQRFVDYNLTVRNMLNN